MATLFSRQQPQRPTTAGWSPKPCQEVAALRACLEARFAPKKHGRRIICQFCGRFLWFLKNTSDFLVLFLLSGGFPKSFYLDDFGLKSYLGIAATALAATIRHRVGYRKGLHMHAFLELLKREIFGEYWTDSSDLTWSRRYASIYNCSAQFRLIFPDCFPRLVFSQA